MVEHTDAAEVAREDRLITEEPLEIRVRSGALAARRAWVTMRTPGHDFELAAGWLVNEGLATPASISRVAYCTDDDLAAEEELNVVTVDVTGVADLPHRHETASSGSSACGVCGKDSVAEALATRTASPWVGPRPDASVVRRLPEALRERQTLFARTGGVHAAGLADARGALSVVREDVGRHNAVDKVVGWALTGGRLPLRGTVLMVSGRASFELTQKALMAGIPVLAAVSAPSSLAADLAQESGITLVGFLRGSSMVVYSRPERVLVRVHA